MKFYIGLHIPAHAGKFENSFISVNVLKKRVGDITPKNWILDSGAFTQVERHGDFQMSVPEYISQANRWNRCGNLIAAVSQDYMCEPHILKKWNRTVQQHQKMTVDRYYEIVDRNPDVYIIPVLQGYSTEDYLKCVDMYDFWPQTYVGIGSVCKRNGNPEQIYQILKEVKSYSGYHIHGFGLKQTSLKDPRIRELLFSSDSMAWSFNARAASNFTWPNRANDWTYAMEWYNQLKSIEGVV